MQDQSNNSSQSIHVGQIIVDAFSLLLNNFPLLLTIGLIGASFTILDQILKLILFYMPPEISFLLAIPAFLISYWAMMAMTYAVSQKYLNQPVDIKEAFIKGAQGRYLKYLGVTISLVVMVGLGFMLFIVPGVYLVTIFSLTATVVVLENPPFVECFKRSKDLVSGNFWRVLLIVLFTFAFILPVSALTSPQFAATRQTLMQLIGHLYNVFYSVLATVVYVTLYYRIRQVKD